MRSRKLKSFLKNAADFFLQNLLPSAGFFVTYRLWGAKTAVAFAVVVTLVQLIYLRFRYLKPTPFFLIASGFTIIFGGISLFFTDPYFYRFEPAAQNVAAGMLFVGSLFTKMPLVQWLMVSLPPAARPPVERLPAHYFKVLTLVWGLHFFIKAFLYYYMSSRVDLGSLILFRSIIGWFFGMVLIGGEFFYRKTLTI